MYTQLPYNDELRSFITENEDLGEVTVNNPTDIQFKNGLRTYTDIERLYNVCHYVGKRMLATINREKGKERVSVSISLLSPVKDPSGNVIPEISQYMVSIDDQLFRRCNGNAVLGSIII
jgi:hypothetical protein